jgi:hypothetical protein
MEERSGESGGSLGSDSSNGNGLGFSPSRAPIDQLQTSLWRLEEELKNGQSHLTPKHRDDIRQMMEKLIGKYL